MGRKAVVEALLLIASQTHISQEQKMKFELTNPVYILKRSLFCPFHWIVAGKPILEARLLHDRSALKSYRNP